MTQAREPIAQQLDRVRLTLRTFTTHRNLEQEEAEWLAKFQKRTMDEHHPALIWEKRGKVVLRHKSYLPVMVKFGKHCYPTQPDQWMAE